jgi:hypothetical protein
MHFRVLCLCLSLLSELPQDKLLNRLLLASSNASHTHAEIRRLFQRPQAHSNSKLRTLVDAKKAVQFRRNCLAISEHFLLRIVHIVSIDYLMDNVTGIGWL